MQRYKVGELVSFPGGATRQILATFTGFEASQLVLPKGFKSGLISNKEQEDPPKPARNEKIFCEAGSVLIFPEGKDMKITLCEGEGYYLDSNEDFTVQAPNGATLQLFYQSIYPPP